MLLLDKVNTPSDVKKLTEEEMNLLAQEIRDKIVETVSENGGHLASNLGVVELTIALHSIFDVPKDKIIWDVGHQCYAHKILTERKEQINTIRTENGLSGFPKRSESCYDSFNTGHSSTSISAALGIACSEEMQKSGGYAIAVIGDGALSGGLAYEGLNNAGNSGKRLIVILNDNKMSISRNVGSMARYLSHIRIKPFYLHTKSKMHRLEKIPLIGRPITNGMRNVKDWMRDEFFGQKNNLFEQLGFTYLGPYDGHNITELRAAFQAAQQKHFPVLIHVLTKKGKGYEYAEKNPKDFHGVGAFDVETGERRSSTIGYSDVFGRCMCELAQKDSRVCAITAAMSIGTGLREFSHQHKERFYDVGIAEEHAVTFAAGLAVGGMIPVFAVYSTFLQRSYDQLLHDAALQKVHIVLAIDRAGIVGEDGETHQGIYDTAFLYTIPNVTFFAPSSFCELETMLSKALFDIDGVAAIRYPRGGEQYLPEDYVFDGKPYNLYGDTSSSVLLVTYGREFSQVCLALNSLWEQGISVCILKLNTIKPIAIGAFAAAVKFQEVYFFEEGVRSGGVGEHFGIHLYGAGFEGNYRLIALSGTILQAKTEAVLHKSGLDACMITKRIQNDIMLGGTHGRKKKTGPFGF